GTSAGTSAGAGGGPGAHGPGRQRSGRDRGRRSAPSGQGDGPGRRESGPAGVGAPGPLLHRRDPAARRFGRAGAARRADRGRAGRAGGCAPGAGRGVPRPAARGAVIVPLHLPPRESWQDWRTPPGLTPGQDLLGGALRRLRSLEDSGLLDRVLLVRSEPGSAEGMRDALALARSRFGPVRGVFHTAGVSAGGLIQLKTRESVLFALAPAALGAQALLAALEEEAEPPRFVLLSASVLTLTGGLGQLDLAASGAFLEALALCRSRQDGPAVVAVHWDPYQWDSWLAGAG